MKNKDKAVEQYFEAVGSDRQEAVLRLRDICLIGLKGTEECMSYGMIGYVVPFKTYPDGYHCDTSLPLPFVGLANQKGHIGLYHMGLYADQKLMDWFVAEYPKHSKFKLDMGKSCIRFKKPDQIPFDLIAELMKKMQVKDWIAVYEKAYKPSTKKRA
jgi:hypothetical protein